MNANGTILPYMLCNSVLPVTANKKTHRMYARVPAHSHSDSDRSLLNEVRSLATKKVKNKVHLLRARDK